MFPLCRYLCGLTMLAALFTVAAASPAPAPIVLRYHYVAGQQFAYQVTETVGTHITLSNPATGAARGSSKSALAVRGVVVYHITHVSEVGLATAQVRIGPETVTGTQAGQPVSTTVPAPPALTDYLGADGSQRVPGTTPGSASLGVSTATLPAGHVRPGARRTSTEALSLQQVPGLTGLPNQPITATITNVYTGTTRLDGRAVAVLTSSGHAHAALTVSNGGVRLRVTLDGRLSRVTFLGLTAGHTVMDRTTWNLGVVVLGGRDTLTGQPTTVHESVTDTTVRRSTRVPATLVRST